MRRVFNGSEEIIPAAAQEEQQTPVQSTVQSAPADGETPVQSTVQSAPVDGETPRRAARRSMRGAAPVGAGNADAPFRASIAAQPSVAQPPVMQEQVKSEVFVRPARMPLNTKPADVSSSAPAAEKPFERRTAPAAEKPFERNPVKREVSRAEASAPVQEPENNQYANMFASWDLLPPTMIIRRVKRGI